MHVNEKEKRKDNSKKEEKIGERYEWRKRGRSERMLEKLRRKEAAVSKLFSFLKK